MADIESTESNEKKKSFDRQEKSEAENNDSLTKDSKPSLAEAKKEKAPKQEDEVVEISLKEKEKLVSERDQFKEKYYYLAAEMENLRKRSERERTNLIKYGNERILTELLSVVDNFDLSLGALKGEKDEKVKNILVGVEMVKTQLLDILKQSGLTPIETEGKTFDPNFHEALGQREEEGKKENEIIEEFQKGYSLNDRVLRASKVIIAKDKKTK